MSRTASVAALLLSAVLGLAALTGCGAGAETQTANQRAGINGYSGELGSISVRDATIPYSPPLVGGAVYPAGAIVPSLNMVLVNSGPVADRLVSVSTPVASSVLILGDATLPPETSITVGNDFGFASASLAGRTITIRLIGLTEPVRAGLNYPVTFTFERAGVLQADIPVGYPEGDLGERGIERLPAVEHAGGHG